MILGIKTKNANRNNKHKLTNNNICIFSFADFLTPNLISEIKKLMGYHKFARERGSSRKTSGSFWCLRKTVPSALHLKAYDLMKNT